MRITGTTAEEVDSDDYVQISHCGFSARYSPTWISLGCVISTWTSGSLRSISSLGIGQLSRRESFREVRALRHVWVDSG